jgi:hypothetical protein
MDLMPLPLAIIGGIIARAAIGAAARYLGKKAAQKVVQRLMKRALKEGQKRLDDEIGRLSKCKGCKKLDDKVNPCQFMGRGNPLGSGPYRGGSYNGTKKSGMEAHHIPADSSYPPGTINSGQMPAIQMDPTDHMRTASHGSQPGSAAYRNAQNALIKSGNTLGALAMDIADIKAKFGDKYDEAIAEATAYAACLKKYKKIR